MGAVADLRLRIGGHPFHVEGVQGRGLAHAFEHVAARHAAAIEPAAGVPGKCRRPPPTSIQVPLPDLHSTVPFTERQDANAALTSKLRSLIGASPQRYEKLAERMNCRGLKSE